MDVHRELGTGLLESAYEESLSYELNLRGLSIARQKPLPLKYKNISLDCSYKLDLVVENLIIVEIKAVETILPIHEAQLLSYLKISGLKLGLLINFNVKLLRNGIRRKINGYLDMPASKILCDPRDLRGELGGRNGFDQAKPI